MQDLKPRSLRPIKRLIRNLIIFLIIMGSSLFLGMWGYRHYEKMSWVDSYANAAMILSGMGPLSSLHTSEGKIFAGTYALFSGVVFILAIGVVLIPILHWFFHKFHIEEEKAEKK